ncbi:hypothetical protein RJZ56_001125 [Blastomyces dermatitidis]|uniref:Uncharacterized protein n=1 Tax=Ajellomyces dermatitidis (strain ER-3 / ATCC MYA-2586) TaxID=559297 RepID=A0ABP2F5M7_AJEDR|nr:25S rRNA (uracil2843-N3)-methyltransferase [Blastomyces dermatitidis ER-3]EEQ91733.1 hypothetical protein BDCG_06853 [Blastomyces dermatitidis ER-3]EQL31796.1 hypothetical protein BDFG_05857 [Blastomyces dermatitidis ATCC 26199]
MAASNRRGKDVQKSKGKNSVKSKTAPRTAHKPDSVKSSGKSSSKGARTTRILSASDDRNSRLLLEATQLPISLQQLLLNVFQSGLCSDRACEPDPLSRPLSELVQILKTHLYNRDFLSAFADANEELLKAYALRWSAGRALGYAGIFASVLEMIIQHRIAGAGSDTIGQHIVCIGGGAGAEIVGLAAAWRWLNDGGLGRISSASGAASEAASEAVNSNREAGISSLGIEMQSANIPDIDHSEEDRVDGANTKPSGQHPFQDLSITSIDIADWSSLVNTLNKAMLSESIPSSKACPAPLVSCKGTRSPGDGRFRVFFKKADVLSLTDQELFSLLTPPSNDINGDMDLDKITMDRNEAMLVTLMFTLNELFSTSIPKTTAFLLRLTDMLRPGTILLVVDSPGSYSTVTFATKSGRPTQQSSTSSTSLPSDEDGTTRQDVNVSADNTKKQRNYPMRFLLDHALLSVADGNWARVVSDDSRWFRRDASLLKYQVGDGIGLEDMRFQIHVYRRLKS